MKVKSKSEVGQSCPTHSDPTDCSHPGSSVHAIFQARVLEWGAIAFSSFLSTSRLFVPTSIGSASIDICHFSRVFLYLLRQSEDVQSKYNLT